MPSVLWPLLHDRPTVQLSLQLALDNQQLVRTLLADSGAGSLRDPFELILDEDDCLLCGGVPVRNVSLGGAYAGLFPIYLLQVQIPELGFEDAVPAVGVPNTPRGFEGIACLRFLSRFSYGNFAKPEQFGLETFPVEPQLVAAAPIR
jgi:hypothetical protein